MNVQELRIGNWITDENDFPMQIVTVGTDYIYADFEGNEGDVWEFDFKNTIPKSIPLTEETLLKCGFENDEGFYHLNNFWISNYYEHYYSLDGFNDSKIYHLHQLQNLYFALTNKELEVNL